MTSAAPSTLTPPSPSSHPLPSPTSLPSLPSSMSPSPSSGTRRSVGQYIVTKRLGHGSFATVWRGYHRHTNVSVAIKSISRVKLSGHVKHADNLQSEISILQTLHHPNIVQLYELQSSDRHIYLIMEFCAGGDLSQFLRQHKALPLPLVQHFARQLMDGLHVLHSRQLIHRDLKPQNLLLDQSTSPHTAVLKLADFGFARELTGEDLAATLCGSPLYMAPEILRYQPYDGKADLWSVGAIVYEMVVGRPPYTGQNHIQLLQRIDKEEVQFPPSIAITAEARDFIVRLLKRKPEERMSFNDFFQHPFVQVQPQRNNRSDPEEMVSGRGGGAGGGRDRDSSNTSSEDDAAALRVSSTLANYNRVTGFAADRGEVMRSSQAALTPALSSVNRPSDSGTLPAPSPSRLIGRSGVDPSSGGDTASETADRAGIVLASSPPLDIPSSSSSFRRISLKTSPLLAPASTSPLLTSSNSPPTPSPPFLATSSTGRRLSSSRSGSFDERLPGQRRDSAGSRGSGSGSGSGTAESTQSADRAKTSGSFERDDYVVVDDQAVLDSPSQDNRPSAPQATSPSFRSSMGKLSSTIYSTLTSSLYTAQPTPVAGSDSPTLPPISEVPYTLQEMEEDGDVHHQKASSLLRATVPTSFPSSSSLPPLHAAFRQSVQSVLFDVHLAWTIGRCADLYRDQAKEQWGQEEPLPLAQRLQPFMPSGESVSLQACAVGLYVKALTLLHHCVDFMEGDWLRIVQDSQDTTAQQQPTQPPQPQQRSSASSAMAQATSAVYKGLSWQDVYVRVLSLIGEYSNAALKAAQPLRPPSASLEKKSPSAPALLFEVGSHSTFSRESTPAQSPTSQPTTAIPSSPLTFSTSLLPPLALSPDATPSTAAASTVLTFTSSTPSSPPSSLLPSAVDPVLSCYYAVCEWLSVGLLHEGSGEWSAADLHYRLARTLIDLLREEVNGSGGAGTADTDLLNSIAEQIDLRVHSVATEGKGDQTLREDSEGADEVWRAEDDAVYGPNINAEA